MSIDAHPAPGPDEWGHIVGVAIAKLVRRSARTLTNETYQDLRGMGMVALAELDAQGKLKDTDRALLVRIVMCRIVDQLREDIGRVGFAPKAHANTMSLDDRESWKERGFCAMSWHDVHADADGELELERVLDVAEARWVLARLYPRLSDRERFVLEMYAGGMTLREIGQALGVTESRVSQLLTQLRAKGRRVGPQAA